MSQPGAPRRRPRCHRTACGPTGAASRTAPSECSGSLTAHWSRRVSSRSASRQEGQASRQEGQEGTPGMLEHDVEAGRTPPPLATADPSAYLGADDVVQSGHQEIVRLAGELREDTPDDVAFTRVAYEWVRDQVTHSVDAQDPTV